MENIVVQRFEVRDGCTIPLCKVALHHYANSNNRCTVQNQRQTGSWNHTFSVHVKVPKRPASVSTLAPSVITSIESTEG